MSLARGGGGTPLAAPISAAGLAGEALIETDRDLAQATALMAGNQAEKEGTNCPFLALALTPETEKLIEAWRRGFDISARARDERAKRTAAAEAEIQNRWWNQW